MELDREANRGVAHLLVGVGETKLGEEGEDLVLGDRAPEAVLLADEGNHRLHPPQHHAPRRRRLDLAEHAGEDHVDADEAVGGKAQQVVPGALADAVVGVAQLGGQGGQNARQRVLEIRLAQASLEGLDDLVQLVERLMPTGCGRSAVGKKGEVGG